MKKTKHAALAESKGRTAYYLTPAEAALVEHFRWEQYCKDLNGEARLKLELCDRCMYGRHFLDSYIIGEDGNCDEGRSFGRSIEQYKEFMQGKEWGKCNEWVKPK